ncbi:PadR family transcriptional regulator [Halobacillus hunanensis]|uniref:PadR family transcriptional regulator n=1 Tax=Halobacillus hunanensis TaxID=578214 RepID=UPI0009A55DA9|nr:helix-turn-helix transcriptional regulator [Halobacillus hunanensis]
MNKEMLKGTIDLLILSLLNEKDGYGYEISKAIKEKTEGKFEMQEATLYLSLKRLEKNGAIYSYWGKESQGGRRKYYAITGTGKQQLQQYIKDWVQMAEVVKHFI